MENTKIFIVDDEEVEATDIKNALEALGYNVPYIAQTGDDAVDETSKIMPDLLF